MGAGGAMRAWIDRTNDGLSGMPADGISLPPQRGDFGTSRWAGSKVRLHQPGDWPKGHDRLWHTASFRCGANVWTLLKVKRDMPRRCAAYRSDANYPIRT